VVWACAQRHAFYHGRDKPGHGEHEEIDGTGSLLDRSTSVAALRKCHVYAVNNARGRHCVRGPPRRWVSNCPIPVRTLVLQAPKNAILQHGKVCILPGLGHDGRRDCSKRGRERQHAEFIRHIDFSLAGVDGRIAPVRRLSTAIDADKTAGARLYFRDVPPHAGLFRDQNLLCIISSGLASYRCDGASALALRAAASCVLESISLAPSSHVCPDTPPPRHLTVTIRPDHSRKREQQTDSESRFDFVSRTPLAKDQQNRLETANEAATRRKPERLCGPEPPNSKPIWRHGCSQSQRRRGA
jgi:hypothetical protein